MDLLELRKEIDRIDDQLIPLLMARMDVSEQVAKYKVERGIPVLNEERERQILDDVAGKCGDRGETIISSRGCGGSPGSAAVRMRRVSVSCRFKKRDHGSLAGRPHCCGTR